MAQRIPLYIGGTQPKILAKIKGSSSLTDRPSKAAVLTSPDIPAKPLVITREERKKHRAEPVELKTTWDLHDETKSKYFTGSKEPDHEGGNSYFIVTFNPASQSYHISQACHVNLQKTNPKSRFNDLEEVEKYQQELKNAKKPIRLPEKTEVEFDLASVAAGLRKSVGRKKKKSDKMGDGDEEDLEFLKNDDDEDIHNDDLEDYEDINDDDDDLTRDDIDTKKTKSQEYQRMKKLLNQEDSDDGNHLDDSDDDDNDDDDDDDDSRDSDDDGYSRDGKKPIKFVNEYKPQIMSRKRKSQYPLQTLERDQMVDSPNASVGSSIKRQRQPRQEINVVDITSQDIVDLYYLTAESRGVPIASVSLNGSEILQLLQSSKIIKLQGQLTNQDKEAMKKAFNGSLRRTAPEAKEYSLLQKFL